VGGAPSLPRRLSDRAFTEPGRLCDASRMPGVKVVPIPVERLDEFEDLWQALYEHHNSVTPQLRERSRPFAESWRSRRELERRWAESEPGSFVLAALQDDRRVGYAYVRIHRGGTFSSSWSFSDPLAELSALAVAPSHRGRGVGSALLDAVERRLGEMDVQDMVIGVMVGNDEAMRFYERRGALPYVTELVQRLGGRAGTAPDGAPREHTMAGRPRVPDAERR
jgi:ribosomal protein S18 acetylase RimI-like enzyme